MNEIDQLKQEVKELRDLVMELQGMFMANQGNRQPIRVSPSTEPPVNPFDNRLKPFIYDPNNPEITC